jgi:hypothetical protein
MFRLVPLAILLALPLSAQAQLGSYCNGRLHLTDISTQATPTGMEYFASLRNVGPAVLTVTLIYRGGLTDRPTQPIRFSPAGPATRVKLGRQTPGSPRLLQGQVIQDITISNC